MGNKKNNKQNTNVKSENDYDVRKNLKKLRLGKSRTTYVTGETPYTKNSDERLTNQNSNESLSTGELLDLNDNMHLRYDKLKDNFNEEIKEIKKEQGTFVKEFTEKYISKSDFWKIITGLCSILVVIGSMFFAISYSDVLRDTKDTKISIIKIRNSVDSIQRSVIIVYQIGKKVDSLQKEISTLNDSISVIRKVEKCTKN